MNGQATISNIKALEWLVEWGTVTIGYEHAEFNPSSPYRMTYRINGDYGPDLLIELCAKVQSAEKLT